MDAQHCQNIPGHIEHFFRFYITILVMTVTNVSAGHQDAVGTLLKSL